MAHNNIYIITTVIILGKRKGIYKMKKKKTQAYDYNFNFFEEYKRYEKIGNPKSYRNYIEWKKHIIEEKQNRENLFKSATDCDPQDMHENFYRYIKRKKRTYEVTLNALSSMAIPVCITFINLYFNTFSIKTDLDRQIFTGILIAITAYSVYIFLLCLHKTNSQIAFLDDFVEIVFPDRIDDFMFVHNANSSKKHP